ENALAINVHQHANPKHKRHQVRTSIADKRQRESLVRQKRRRHADVDRCLQSEERNNPATEQQSKTITSVQRNHDAADNYHNEQKKRTTRCCPVFHVARTRRLEKRSSRFLRTPMAER